MKNAHFIATLLKMEYFMMKIKKRQSVSKIVTEKSNCQTVVKQKNAICLQNFQKPVKLDTGHYGIPLKNTLYKLSHFTTLATAKPSIVVIVFFLQNRCYIN